MVRSLHQYSPRVQMLACALVSALGMAAAWQVLIGPGRNDLARRRARLATVIADVERATQDAQRLPGIERRVAVLEAELHRIIATVPAEMDAQAILRSLHVLASEANLSITSLTPQPVANRATYSEWPMEVGLEGGFHDVGRFFDRLSAETQLISVSQLHLKANPGAEAGRRGSVLASCIATTVVFSRVASESRQ